MTQMITTPHLLASQPHSSQNVKWLACAQNQSGTNKFSAIRNLSHVESCAAVLHHGFVHVFPIFHYLLLAQLHCHFEKLPIHIRPNCFGTKWQTIGNLCAWKMNENRNRKKMEWMCSLFDSSVKSWMADGANFSFAVTNFRCSLFN